MDIFEILEDLFVAITFAEVGEFETAQEILKEEREEREIEVSSSIQPLKP